MTIYAENAKPFIKELLKLIYGLRKVSGYKINRAKQFIFL
jgi:hypothetical protein